jgi:ABC-2 type transport system ATP-binding protein
LRQAVEEVIVLDKVTKRFKKNKKEFTAVDRVSLKIRKGQIFGLLGPNGAGKTTTLNMICTLLLPTSGRILLGGIDVVKDTMSARSKIGLVFQETTLDLDLTGWENLDFHTRLYKIKDRRRRIAEALALVGLTADKDVVCKSYSGGMKRRLEIARSIIHDPSFILLDEPTLGLDPVSRRDMWKHISTLIEHKGVTVILTTHYLEEAERLCSEIAIMDKGRIVVQGTPEQLKAKIGNDVVTVILRKEDKGLVQELRRNKRIKKLVVEGNQLTLYMKDVDKNIVDLLRHFNDSQITSLQIKKPSLDDVFLHYAGRKYEEEK